MITTSTKSIEINAEALALDFLLYDLEIPDEDQEFFTVLSSRRSGTEWQIVEIGVEGLPDKWVLQVFDTGLCDPCYTFVTPVSRNEIDTGLEDFPEAIAMVMKMERQEV